MTDETQLLREMDRGSRAKSIIEDELVQEALATIRQSLHDKFEQSRSADKDVREEIYRLLKITNEFERHLRTIMETGKMAAKQRESLLQRFKKSPA